MDDLWARVAENMHLRVEGPMKFRLIMQPLVAITLAVLAGLKDARDGKGAYFWGLFHDPANRADMLRDGWKDVGKVFLLAVILDVAFQLIALKKVYPGEAIVMGIVLALIPYLMFRGLANRLAPRK